MRVYREEGFPVTIVRPSLTYGDAQITLAINSRTQSYTVVDRMRRGKKVIVPGDGSSLWVITHNTDFAKGLTGLLGLLGDKAASVVFDNTKIKRFVPGYCATVPFSSGIRRTLAWFDADPARRQVDAEAGDLWDKLPRRQ
jgi:nucleoside-diphosphate-sugar epimerase